MNKELIFLAIAILGCFITASLLLYPFRKTLSLMRWGIVSSIPILVVFFLWEHDFFSHIPQKHLQTASNDLEKLRQNFEKNPNDLTKLLALNDAYLEKNQFDASLTLLERAIKKTPQNSFLKLKLAETLLFAEGGEVSEDLRALFHHFAKDKHASDETRALANFYLGLYDAQKGGFYEALEKWKKVVKESHMDDPWLALVVPAIKKVSIELNLPPHTQIPKPKALRKVRS